MHAYKCVCMCVYVCIDRMYVCIFVSMYVRMYVCIFVSVYVSYVHHAGFKIFTR